MFHWRCGWQSSIYFGDTNVSVLHSARISWQHSAVYLFIVVQCLTIFADICSDFLSRDFVEDTLISFVRY